jgi:hypothetical protein
VAADRIIPDRVGEVYYLTHNPKHKWYAAGKKMFCLILYTNLLQVLAGEANS